MCSHFVHWCVWAKCALCLLVRLSFMGSRAAPASSVVVEYIFMVGDVNL